MRSQQRWREVYQSAHPLALPKAIHQQLQDSARAAEAGGESIRHLWVVLSKEGVCSQSNCPEEMDTALWLNLVDESAALGVSSIIISVGEDLAARPEVWEIFKWGQDTHNMLVGLHLTAAVDPEALSPMRSLLANNAFVFVHSSRLAQFQQVEKEWGIRVYASDGLEDGVEQRHCTLPTQMACVGGAGKLYTCGLVLDNAQYELGDARGDRVDNALTDDSLPHSVPAGTSNEPHRCDGCPPLMEDRMRKATGRS